MLIPHYLLLFWCGIGGYAPVVIGFNRVWKTQSISPQWALPQRACLPWMLIVAQYYGALKQRMTTILGLLFKWRQGRKGIKRQVLWRVSQGGRKRANKERYRALYWPIRVWLGFWPSVTDVVRNVVFLKVVSKLFCEIFCFRVIRGGILPGVLGDEQVAVYSRNLFRCFEV